MVSYTFVSFYPTGSVSHGGIQGYQNNSIFVFDKIVEIIIISHKLSIIIFNKSIIILPLIIKVKFCNM